MKHILFTLFLFASISYSQTLESQTSPALEPQVITKDLCPDILKAFKNIQLQQSLSGDGRKCYLGIHPRDAFETLIYRDYLLAHDGLMMIFNSFAPDEGPASDGAREFYFLPTEFKGYTLKTENDSLIIRGFQNLELKFSMKTAQLESISGAEIQVKDEVVPENQGGVEILSFNGVYLDAGFLMRNSPSSKPQRTSTWKNSHNQQCRMRNQEIFKYVDRENIMKPNDELKRLISTRCPNFKLD